MLFGLFECVQPQTQCSQCSNCRLNEPELCSVLVYKSGRRRRVRVAIGLGVGDVRIVCAKEFGNTFYYTTTTHHHCVRRNCLPYPCHACWCCRTGIYYCTRRRLLFLQNPSRAPIINLHCRITPCGRASQPFYYWKPLSIFIIVMHIT